MSTKPKKLSKKAPSAVCQSKISIVCACGKKIEHGHYTFPDKDGGRTGHGKPKTFPKPNTSKTFKK